VIRRYLRIYYLEPKGALLGSDSVVSNVLMPLVVIPGTRLRAGKVTMASHKRRNAAAAALSVELRRSKPRFVGVALVLCEAAKSGEGAVAKRFVGSFAALGTDRSLYVGDVMGTSLDQAITAISAEMRRIAMPQKDAKQV